MATEDAWRLVISDSGSRGIVLSVSAPLFSHLQNRCSYITAHVNLVSLIKANQAKILELLLKL